ncbi:MAG: CBS domain-containing protein [Novosphingobium sp.]|nr:CBS domain-containing protein [Novosphingobium sp.]
MQVSQIMTPDPDVAQLADTLQAVAAKMDSGDYGSMPVVDDGRLVGVLTDRDIAVRAVAQGLGPETAVSEVMTPDPVCIAPESDVEEAAEIMQEEQIRRLFVTDDDDRLVGVVALGDVALGQDEDLSGRTLEEISE